MSKLKSITELLNGQAKKKEERRKNLAANRSREIEGKKIPNKKVKKSSISHDLTWFLNDIVASKKRLKK